MSSLTLNLRDVSLLYAGEEKKVLDDISLEVAGGITMLMGPNGSGKSSLMNICALLSPPTSGTVSYSDADGPVEDGLELRRRITMVIPRGGIFNSSVCANAAYGLKVRGIRGEALKHRAHDVLGRVGLLSKIKQNALSLSSGEAQRLALARAMAINPEALLLDEPTASVDEDNTGIIEGIISELGQSLTIIMATHDRAQAERLGAKVVLMSKGRLVI